MERLTYEKSPHQWDRGKYPAKYTSRHTFQEVVARLAAYEDTLPLERAQELAQAEKDGRLVVLPAKRGDTVYIIRDQKIIITAVETIHQWSGEKWTLNVCTDKKYRHWVGYEVSFDDFGETAFLTRAEAEAALKKREED